MTKVPKLLDPPAPHRPERASILLVAENPTSLASWREIVGSSDYDLVETCSGEEVFEQMKTREFAVVLLDVGMPGLSGFETAKLLRVNDRFRHIPIIFLTTDDIDQTQVEAGYTLGATDFFLKPLSSVVAQAKVRGFARLYEEKQRVKTEADQLRLLIQGTVDYAIFMLDPNGLVLTWNTGAERIKQYQATEIIGQHFSRFYPQDAIDRSWPDHELKVATAEGRFEDEGWRLRKDGSKFWANVVITVLRDEAGHLRGYSKVTRDLTERKQAEESLRRSEERFRHMVEGVHDYAIFMLDPQGHVVSWNQGAERFKGYKADEIIGQHFSRFYPQEALDRGWPTYELRVAAAEGRFEDEGWRVCKDGSQFWANVVITAINDERGDLLGFSKITRDLTGRKQAEEDARRLAEETAARRVSEEYGRFVQEQRKRLEVTLASIGDAVISTDAQGQVDFLNTVAEALVGWKMDEAVGRSLEDIFSIVNETTRQPVENPALRALRDGKIVELAKHTLLISKDGAECPIDDSAAPIRDQQGDIFGSVLVFRDITDRKRAEAALHERVRHLSLNADVGKALVQEDGLGAMLQQCSEAMVKHLDGAFARIWTLNPKDDILELWASAGRYTHLDGPHSRVPVGKYKIGMIAQDRQPHLTNAVVGDPRVTDQEWAQREGMIAFAGYPLVVDDRLVGVMAMFARHQLTEATVEAMASVADKIAVGIERKSSQERLNEQREWLAVTLASIGDAVITIDDRGRVTFLNGVAEVLTGWASEDAQGKPLEAVFLILNEQTRKPVENPVEKVLREGVTVGLANHTVLVARDGSERSIDDSAAPIRDAAGVMLGVVLIFRDVTEKRRAEHELRVSEARKTAILETALDCVITMDHHGNVVEFNPAAERTFGYPRGKVVGRSLADLIIPPQYRENHRLGMAHYLATGEGPVLGKRLELSALRADGTEFPVELAITSIPTEGPPLFTAYLRDITEVKRAEAERAKLLTRLNLQIERLPLAYVLFDADFRYIGWNPTAERMFGFTKAEVLGKHPFELIVAPYSRPLVAERFARLSAGDMNANGESDSITKDGRTITCEWYNTPLFDPDGTFEGVLSLAQDVTERKRAEEGLRLRDRAIQAVSEGILITDASQSDNPIIFASPGFERITGYSAAEAVGRNCRFLQGPDSDNHSALQLQEAIQAGRSCMVEILNYRKDGTPFWNAVSISPVRNDRGELTHYVVVQADVTARRGLEKQVRQSQKMEAIGNLAGGLAHDFNNLLTVINGYSELIDSQLPNQSPVRGLVREIGEAGERAASLTRQLLAFSRNQVLEIQVVNLNAVVTNTARMLKRLIGEDIDFNTALDPGLGEVKADLGQIEQILINLSVNARDAMPQGGKLTIETRNAELSETYTQAYPDLQPGAYALLAVTDTGTGIDEQTMAHIFEPFFTTKEVGKGTGLGLATVFGIVKQSGGHVAVYSVPGSGATFKVYLPRVEECVSASTSHADDRFVPKGSETILLVEDEPALLALSHHILQRQGYTILKAGDGETALRIAEEYHGEIHLLMTDVVMPGMSGRQVAERITAQRPDVKVLFQSGYTDDAVVRHGVLQAETAFLQKPFTPTTLSQKVRDVLNS